jgi:hypothetical protein
MGNYYVTTKEPEFSVTIEESELIMSLPNGKK